MREHIIFDAGKRRLLLLDQRLLPCKTDYVSCENAGEVIAAIKNMVVRGAPAIGSAAAFACVLASFAQKKGPDFRENLGKTLEAISSARPTAVNLAWAVERMRKAAAGAEPERLPDVWLAEARKIQAEDIAACRAMGRYGQELVADGDTILTHCNAGALATGGYGTALGVIRAAVEAGKHVRVIADETRPLLQGARLTAWELSEEGIPVKIACDNAGALLLGKGLVQLVITGADRVAANGDVANKIGTFGLAIIARHFNIPFYVACPLSTLDPATPEGAAIPIEERAQEEVLQFAGVRTAPQNVQAFNFAFDVTPANLVDAIITEAGILRPPYAESIERALGRQ